MRISQIVSLGSAVIAANALRANAQDQSKPKDLASLGLEELMNVRVTTESKQAQPLSRVPAAIYVVTQEQIRRSGATNVPEALRMVPGVQVQQVDASKWSIGIRGMANRYSDKLLVMIDGRTVYTPLFSGVFWDAQDIDMALVERIEVIRGPGGTLWGANAVNGIINIIMKPSSETPGDRITLQSSTLAPYDLDVSHGGTMKSGTFRVFGRAHREQSLDTIENMPGGNGWDGLRAGFRSDWSVKGDSFTFSSEANTSHQGQTTTVPSLYPPFTTHLQDRYATSEFYALGRWERTEGKSQGTSLQVSFDHSDRNIPEVDEQRTTFTADFQRPVSLSRNNQMIWGLGYNVSSDQEKASLSIALNPAMKTASVYSAFLHDEQKLSSKATFSFGTKIEHNDYTGWENQPSARLLYTPTATQSVWASVSRAVKTPSRGDTADSIFFTVVPGPGGVPTEVTLLGNPALKSQEVIAHEVGWRYEPSTRWFVDVAAFYNRYAGLRGASLQPITLDLDPFPHGVAALLEGNDYSATTAGIEVATRVVLNPKWSLDGSYALYSEHYNLTNPLGGVLGLPAAGSGAAPRHQLSFRSQLDLPHRMELDLTEYYVGALGSNVAPYGRTDLRFGWHPDHQTECSVGVTNLTNVKHREANGYLFDDPALARRSMYARLTIRF